MKIPLYQVDAFATRLFEGNPAAVVPLDSWLDDDVLSSIAMENNLSETAFFVNNRDVYDLRWFTPEAEVDLCGHATLAAAHVLFEHLAHSHSEVTFKTASGDLVVRREAPGYRMDFPAVDLEPIDPPDQMYEAVGRKIDQCLLGRNLVVVVKDEKTVKAIRPNQETLKELPGEGLIVTAPGDKMDFVSRYFCPKFGIEEDPVTGSAHCELTPFWSKKTGRTSFTARQVSRRGGTIHCRLRGDRVHLVGEAVDYLQGEIVFP